MRYHTAAALVKSLIDEGTIGKIFAMAGTNRLQRSLPATEPWFVDPELSGGGAVMDHTVHLADLMRWYTGSEAKTVYTLIAKNATPELRVEDTFTTLITFQDGALGTIDGSWCLPDSHPTWGEVAMAVYGTEGYIWLDAFRQNINLYGEKQLTWQYYGCDPDLAMVRGFVQAVLEDKTPTATGWDGRQGVEITLASYQSAREGRPVTLPL
jgi:predicted dehydrogenase